MDSLISLYDAISYQVFKIQHISVKAGSTPLPSIWALEESRDFSSGFKTIRYYAAEQEDCLTYFGANPVDKESGEDPLCLLRRDISWQENENVSGV